MKILRKPLTNRKSRRTLLRMSSNLKLGEPLEVTASEKFIGYLFKIDGDQIVLCNSERFNPQGLVYIQRENVENIVNLDPNYSVPVKEPVAVDQADGAAEEPVEEKKVLQFPGPKASK
jgi:hypothetical protein